MAWRLSAVALTVALLILSCAAAQKRTLVIGEDATLEETHSQFFDAIKANGHELTFADDETELSKHGEFLFDNILLFAPHAEELTKKLKAEDIVAFVDAGHNVLIVADNDVSETVRHIADECGISIDDPKSAVIDHLNFQVGDADHTLVVASNWMANPTIVGRPAAPVLFRGIGSAMPDESARLVPVLRGAASTMSAFVGKPIGGDLQSSGKDTLMVTCLQARNNARVCVAGSLAMFSNKFFTMPVDKFGGLKSEVSGNKEFCVSLALWTMHSHGLLRASGISHRNTVSGEVAPASYRIKDSTEYSVFLEEYDGAKWVPFTGNDVQLEFTMLDPKYRLTMSHDGAGHYTAAFQVPDVYGVYKFVLHYQRHGFTTLHEELQVPVRPFQHNEFERFIPAAYPYYAAAFSIMAGFFLFGFIFLYSK